MKMERMALAAFALAAACAHRTIPAPAPEATSTSEASKKTADPREGNVAVEFLADPDSPKPKLDESQEFIPAAPLATRLPEYPPAALAGGGPSAVVAVRLMIDKGGAVYEVRDSPRLAPYVGPFAAEFRAAVEAVVRRWAFTAPRIDTLGAPRPDMPQRPLAATRYVPTYLDFAFRFSVVDGRGVVSVGSETPATAIPPPERIK